MITQVENPILEVHDLTVSYNKRPVLWNVDFSIPAGSLVGIIGPNGAGKSTLLKAIMNLLPVDSGYVRVFNGALNDARQRVSYVPQRESVDWDFPASVREVVEMGRYAKTGLFKRVTKQDKLIAQQCIEKVQLQGFENRQISQLSGGQQQRVFIARALAQEADIYLMDEPFAGVDAATESAILEILQTMQQEGKTIVVVHHDLQSAAAYFNWFLLLNTRLVASGPKTSAFTPQLLQEAYGGKLTLLSQIGDILEKKNYNVRE